MASGLPNPPDSSSASTPPSPARRPLQDLDLSPPSPTPSALQKHASNLQQHASGVQQLTADLQKHASTLQQHGSFLQDQASVLPKKKKWGGAFLFQQHASTLQQYGLTLEHVYNSPIDSARSTSEPDSELTFEPNDPSDPRNWPEWRKWAIVIALMLIDFSVSWAASRYLPPAEKGMETTFRVPDQAGTPGLRFYVLGLAFGPIALAPLSEYFGPSPVYIISYRMFFLCLLGSALGKSLRGSWCCEFCRG
jgi:hypothetical protein